MIINYVWHFMCILNVGICFYDLVNGDNTTNNNAVPATQFSNTTFSGSSSSSQPANITDDESPVETQSAQCTITAGDVQASAQATISKKLEGVCGTKQMARSFEILEARLMIELNQIKAILNSMQPPQMRNSIMYGQTQFHSPAVTYPSYQSAIPPIQPPLQQYQPPMTGQQQIPLANDRSLLQHSLSTEQPLENQLIPTTTPVIPSIKSIKSLKYRTTTEHDPATSTPKPPFPTPQTTTTTERIIEFKPVQTKSLSLSRLLKPRTKQKTMPRDFEVHKFNNTILSGGEIRIFTYYWRIENFIAKLQSNVSRISSPIFSISGLHLKVNAILNHLNRDYLYLQLESVPYESIEDDSNVILETGDVFKEIETKTYFRHKIVIMDQETPNSDLISQEFLNTNSGFPVPNSAIVSGPYAKDSNILIKIVIFL